MAERCQTRLPLVLPALHLACKGRLGEGDYLGHLQLALSHQQIVRCIAVLKSTLLISTRLRNLSAGLEEKLVEAARLVNCQKSSWWFIFASTLRHGGNTQIKSMDLLSLKTPTRCWRRYDGMPVNCKFSDITVFSFHPVKIIPQVRWNGSHQ